MRFGIYIRSVEPPRGAERVAVNLARGLAERGHQVDLLLEKTNLPLIETLLAGNADVRIVDLRQRDGCACAGRAMQAAAFAAHVGAGAAALVRGRSPCIGPVARMIWADSPPFRALARYMREERPHAVLSFLNYPNAVLLLASRLPGVDTRIVVSVRNHISTAAANRESRWMRSVPRLMRSLFGLADAVVTPSRGVADDVVAITGLPEERVTVVYNPVFRPELEPLSAQPVDHPWLAAGNEPVVMGSGKFKPQKDFPTLLQAFAKVRAARPARLMILGMGADGPALKALADSLGIADDVAFPGHVDNPFAFYSRASVFVLSSKWEGLPNALIEAMACGCPVVSTDCPSGPREILDGGRWGRLVPVGSVEGMAAAIMAELSDPAPRSRQVERARQFSLEAAVRGFEAVMVG